MTYGRVKSITKALLISDNVLTKDADELLGLLEYAFQFVSNKAEALHLLTMNKDAYINRLAAGDWLSRKPELPTADSDELDIDHELCFAVARYMASLVSKLKPQIHEAEAIKIINDYNSKVYQIMEVARQEIINEYPKGVSCDSN